MTNMFACAAEDGVEWEKDFSACSQSDVFYNDRRRRLQLKEVRGHSVCVCVCRALRRRSHRAEMWVYLVVHANGRKKANVHNCAAVGVEPLPGGADAFESLPWAVTLKSSPCLFIAIFVDGCLKRWIYQNVFACFRLASGSLRETKKVPLNTNEPAFELWGPSHPHPSPNSPVPVISPPSYLLFLCPY